MVNRGKHESVEEHEDKSGEGIAVDGGEDRRGNDGGKDRSKACPQGSEEETAEDDFFGERGEDDGGEKAHRDGGKTVQRIESQGVFEVFDSEVGELHQVAGEEEAGQSGHPGNNASPEAPRVWCENRSHTGPEFGEKMDETRPQPGHQAGHHPHQQHD